MTVLLLSYSKIATQETTTARSNPFALTLNATYRPNCETSPICSRFQLSLVCLAHFLSGIFPHPHNLISFLLTDREENVHFVALRG